jgi:hypothetical protein
MDHEESNRDNRNEDRQKEDGDEPCDSIGRLRRWLGDAEGVDEGIREKKQWFHVFLDEAARQIVSGLMHPMFSACIY